MGSTWSVIENHIHISILVINSLTLCFLNQFEKEPIVLLKKEKFDHEFALKTMKGTN